MESEDDMSVSNTGNVPEDSSNDRRIHDTGNVSSAKAVKPSKPIRPRNSKATREKDGMNEHPHEPPGVEPLDDDVTNVPRLIVPGDKQVSFVILSFSSGSLHCYISG